MFKPGDLVRHKNMADWGLGRVSGETGDGKVLIKFTGRKGDVLLSQDGAEKFLVLDPTAVWTAAPGTKVKRPPATGRASTRSSSAPRPAAPLMPSPFTKQPPRRIPCVNCAADIQAVRTSPDGTWRSCPSCSTRSGRHHVFLPYPSAFEVPGDAPAAELAASADAAQPPSPVPTPAQAAGSDGAHADGAHGDPADDADRVPAEPEDPHAGWCLACRAGELATGYKTCMKVL